MKNSLDNKSDSERSSESDLYWNEMYNEVCDKKFEVKMKIEKYRQKIERLEKLFINLERKAELLATKL